MASSANLSNHEGVSDIFDCIARFKLEDMHSVCGISAERQQMGNKTRRRIILNEVITDGPVCIPNLINTKAYYTLQDLAGTMRHIDIGPSHRAMIIIILLPLIAGISTGNYSADGQL
jgi:hypothetical protein